MDKWWSHSPINHVLLRQTCDRDTAPAILEAVDVVPSLRRQRLGLGMLLDGRCKTFKPRQQLGYVRQARFCTWLVALGHVRMLSVIHAGCFLIRMQA